MAEKQDAELWAWATRGAKPLRKARPAAPPPKAAAKPVQDKPAPKAAVAFVAESPRRPGAASPGVGLDRRTEQKLRRGLMAVDRHLDLHGMTQDEAHGALLDAIADASGAGERCLLVVTGRGQPGTGRGVLRRMVPLWLEGRRDVVLEWAEAQPRHGGAGALYVLLRRRRAR